MHLVKSADVNIYIYLFFIYPNFIYLYRCYKYQSERIMADTLVQNIIYLGLFWSIEHITNFH